ncbi:hypothetical protein ABE07_08490 [Bacillus thuringiensis]|nr:hypothetical protein BA204_25885 [Bacillus cereus]MBG9642946.1 hypothetical protein [Bacillus thuringiensis]MBG9647963.1 hypothetical protein [Bacillus thuringiensis]MBG9703664.1 hypothetical protein [Bacillus thuringiensis]OHO70019.1 hypothetical protein HMPREF2590_25795 [Bacillus sp. HMSC036E02]
MVRKVDHFNLSERAACTFYLIQLQQLEWSVISPLPARHKTPLRQEFQCLPLLSKPPPLFT